MFPYSELPDDIVSIILDFLIPPVYNLVDWISPSKLSLSICENRHAVDFLRENPEYIDIKTLMENQYGYYFFMPIIKNINIFNDYFLNIDGVYKKHDKERIEQFIQFLLKYKLNKCPIFINIMNKYIKYTQILSDDTLSCYVMCDIIYFIDTIKIIIKSKYNTTYSGMLLSKYVPYNILEYFPIKINWIFLSSNKYAIPILEKNLDKIDWYVLSHNPNAIPLLEKNPDKINWYNLSLNPNAISLLEKNLDKINWFALSGNPNAIPLLKKNIEKINWVHLSANPNAISLLEENPDKIDWYFLSKNPNAISILEKIPDKINWSSLSSNPNAICLLEKNPDKINWYFLSMNTGKDILPLLQKYNKKIDWYVFLKNPNIFKPDLLGKKQYIKFLLKNRK